METLSYVYTYGMYNFARNFSMIFFIFWVYTKAAYLVMGKINVDSTKMEPTQIKKSTFCGFPGTTKIRIWGEGFLIL